MKRLFNSLFLASVFAVSALVSLPVAHAQQYNAATVSTANNYAATTTNAVTDNSITLTKHDLVALDISFKLTGSGTDAVVFKLHESVDGSNYDGTALSSVSLTAAGTTTVRTVVPLNVGAVGFLGLRSVENPNATGITNLVIKAATKPKRQG